MRFARDIFLKVGVIASFLLIHFAAGQVSNGATPSGPLNEPGDNFNTLNTVTLLSDREYFLSLSILIFGVIIIVIEAILLKGLGSTDKGSGSSNIEVIARTYTVTLILIGTLVLITAGFSSQDIAPALGLYGTIAGYLLGRIDRDRSKEETPLPDKEES